VRKEEARSLFHLGLRRIDDAAFRKAKKVEASRTLTDSVSHGSNEDHHRNNSCGEEFIVSH